MTINDFPVSIAVDLTRVSQDLMCRVHFNPASDPETVDVARQTVRVFVDACNLGMLSGSTIAPETAKLNLASGADGGPTLEFRLEFRNVPAASCRALIGMLRGQVLLDQRVTGVEIEPPAAVDRYTASAIDDERLLPLPGLFQEVSFRYVREPSMRLTDRGIRVRWADPIGPDLSLQLGHVQSTWEAVCDGGCCPASKEAVECGILAEPGLVVAAHVFEVKIGVYSNPERCFDYFANAIERLARRTQPVVSLEVW